MIKANELRLGNLVYDWDSDYEFGLNNAFIETVMEISNRTVRFKRGAANFDHIEPIPITHEWLGRMGFVVDKAEEDQRPVYANHNGFHIDWDTLQPIDAGFAIVLYKVEFVHQLQNLYFALTGQELSITT